MAMMRIVIDSQNTERVRLEKMVGKKKSGSLWAMNRAELCEKAKKDLGMTEAQMKDETVTSLRERLRSQKEVVDMLYDPLAKPPKGLDSMLKEELKQECLLREINQPDPCTRPKMIVLIKDDVARRQTMEKRIKHVKLPETDSTFKDAESDAEMETAEKNTRHKKK